MFPLCVRCAETGMEQCTHTAQEREFVGTWFTPELYKAFDRGYEALAVAEVHHFPQRRTGLFKEYVDHFLKGKVEASGWPRENMPREEKEAYVDDYEKPEGIRPRKDREQPCTSTNTQKSVEFFLGEKGAESQPSFNNPMPQRQRLLEHCSR